MSGINFGKAEVYIRTDTLRIHAPKNIPLQSHMILYAADMILSVDVKSRCCQIKSAGGFEKSQYMTSQTKTSNAKSINQSARKIEY